MLVARTMSPATYAHHVQVTFAGELWHWRGPSPFHFVTVPADETASLKTAAALVSYGWGVLPVTAHIGDTTWSTSLIPREGRYLVPIKNHVRHVEAIELGDIVELTLSVNA